MAEVQPASKISRLPNITSEVKDDNSEQLKLSEAQNRRRKRMTCENLVSVHCQSSQAKNETRKQEKAVLDGMWVALVTKSSKEDLNKYFENSKTCMKNVLPNVIKKNVLESEKAVSNKIRSVRVLYEGGLMSKRKYNAIRKCNIEILQGCYAPNILPYKPLSKFIKTIDIGDVKDLREFCQEAGLNPVSGVYRSLEPLLLQLASLYIKINATLPCLHWFNEEVGVFYVALGADGAPFGKDETATAYLVSFLNVLERVASCEDNFLLMGSNCKEDDPVMIHFTKHLVKEMETIEGKKYMVGNLEIKFVFQLVPSDQKWLACMGGELNNAATFFSTFANVSIKNMATLGGNIGDKKATWQCWKFSDRIVKAKAVEKYKKKLSENELKTRTKVTTFIANQKSRQEFEPPLGKFIDKANVEPLHTSNNAWQHLFQQFFVIAMKLTNQQVLKKADTFEALPSTCAFKKFVACLEQLLKCKRLCNNISKWYNEKRKKGQDLSYRFTGKESKCFAWNFGHVTETLLQLNPDKNTVFKLHALHKAAEKLRDSVSLFSRVRITEEQIVQLENSCKEYFNVNALFLQKVNPTVWTIGYAVPLHTKEMVQTLSFGLGLNTMQGREAKHIKLKKYMENTTNVQKGQRWCHVFRHEHIALVWLREIDPHSAKYRRQSLEGQAKAVVGEYFIPKRCGEADYCYCGLRKKHVADSKCSICDSDLMKWINESVSVGKVILALKRYLNI